jgi:hypothetical protein
VATQVKQEQSKKTSKKMRFNKTGPRGFDLGFCYVLTVGGISSLVMLCVFLTGSKREHDD